VPNFGRNRENAEKKDKMDNNRTNRRDFFRKAAQLTFLSAMVGGSAYLLAEDRIQLNGCADNQFCKKCQKLASCSLDQAKNFRKNER
jgi:hypothetical protein